MIRETSIIHYFSQDELNYVIYFRKVENSNLFLPASSFTDHIFTGELSGVDSAGALRQSVL